MKQLRNSLLFTFVLLISSCGDLFDFGNDGTLKCKSDCSEITIKGSIGDGTNNKGLKDKKLKLTWGDPSCFVSCSGELIQTTKTDKNGQFRFDAEIDTSWFENGHSLRIEIDEDSTQIVYPNARYTLFKYTRTVDDVDFKVYKKTNLTIEVDRTENDTFQYFGIEHSIQGGTTNVVYTIPMQDIKDKVTIESETPAGCYTRIYWGKKFSFDNRVEYVDSIFCEENKDNIFKINY